MKTPRMRILNPVSNEVIDGATRLENEWARVHPRLYLPAPAWPGILERAHSPAMAGWMRAFRQQADRTLAGLPPAHAPVVMNGDARGCGCDMATLAFAFRLTEHPRYRTGALRLMKACADVPVWRSLGFGHFAHGFAVAYDGLFDTFTSRQRRRLGEVLRDRCQSEFEHYTSCGDSMSYAYTCNHHPVVLAGLTAGAGALFGEYQGPALWLRMIREKVALIRSALGPDGVSPEGLAYGQYYTEFLFKTLAMLEPLLGQDLFSEIPWCREYADAMLYHTFPRRAWTPQSVFFQFGDSPGGHWYGPDTMLNRCASVFQDPHAQWLAAALQDDGVTCDSANFLNLLWHDPALAGRSPTRRPTFRHFQDMGLVFMRSGWSGSESVLALRCAPPAGHYANTRFRHPVAGGHMHPSAGSLQLVTGDGPLIVHTGYTDKQTAHSSTLLVNGKGQIGEGGEWFEDLEFRKGHPTPCIARAESRRAFDYVLADATAAYPDACGLRRFHRHVIYIKPACWVIMDDLSAFHPAGFEIRFHLASAPEPDAAGGFLVKRGASTLRIWPVAPANVNASIGRCEIKTHFGKAGSDILSIAPARPLCRTRLVTVLQTGSGKAPLPDVRLKLDLKPAGLKGFVRIGERLTRFNITG